MKQHQQTKLPVGVPKTGRFKAAHLAVLLSTLALAGCAGFSPDGGMAVVSGVVSETIQKDVVSIRSDEQAGWARDAVQRLLRRPLTVDTAVQIALLNNKGLQASYNELALAEADLVQESLPPNPTFSLSRIAGDGAMEIERQVVGDILALATLPFRSEIARKRFLAAQMRAAEETLRLAATVRREYFRTIAASELIGLLTEEKAMAESIARLASRLGETGSLNKLDQAREQEFYAETTAELAAARQETASSREKLVRLLGLWDRDLGFGLPRQLPALPRHPQSLAGIEVEAITHRVDLHIARIELDALRKSLNLTQASRFVTLFDVAGISRRERDPDGAPYRERGFGLEFQIPIFDGGEVRVRQASETYNKAFNRLTEKAINIRSEARDAFRVYRSAYDIARHYQREVLPLRKIISEEVRLRFTSMQVDVFALLVEARQRIALARAAIEAKRTFWLAQSDLQTAINGGGGGGGERQGRTSTSAQSSAD